MKKRVFAFAILIASILVPGAVHSEEPKPPLVVLTEREAFELLQAKSARWRQIAQAPIEAEAKEQQARSANLPHISVNVREFTGRTNLLEYGFSEPGAQQLFVFGAVTIQAGYNAWDPASRSRVLAAEENVKAQSFQAEALRNELAYAMLAQYALVQRWESLLKNRTDNIANIEKLRALAERKIRSEVGIDLDLKRAEARLALGHVKRLEAQGNLEKTRRDLASLIGMETLERPLEPIDRKVTLSFDPKSVAPETLLAQRPDYEAAAAQATAAESLAAKEEREAWPKLSIYGQYGYAGAYVVDGVNRGPVYALGASLTLPIYSGGLMTGKLQEARAVSARADAQRTQVALDIRHQAESMVYQYDLAQAALDAARRGAALAEEELALVNRRFAYGSGGGLEVILAQMALAQTRDDLADAWFAHRQASYQVLKHTHRTQEYLKKMEPNP